MGEEGRCTFTGLFADATDKELGFAGELDEFDTLDVLELCVQCRECKSMEVNESWHRAE